MYFKNCRSDSADPEFEGDQATAEPQKKKRRINLPNTNMSLKFKEVEANKDATDGGDVATDETVGEACSLTKTEAKNMSKPRVLTEGKDSAALVTRTNTRAQTKLVGLAGESIQTSNVETSSGDQIGHIDQAEGGSAALAPRISTRYNIKQSDQAGGLQSWASQRKSLDSHESIKIQMKRSDGAGLNQELLWSMRSHLPENFNWIEVEELRETGVNDIWDCDEGIRGLFLNEHQNDNSPWRYEYTGCIPRESQDSLIKIFSRMGIRKKEQEKDADKGMDSSLDPSILTFVKILSDKLDQSTIRNLFDKSEWVIGK